MAERLSLSEYQIDAVNRMHNGCILVGGVGSGKSVTSLAYARKEGLPIIVITIAKKRNSMEWLEDSEKIGVPIEIIDSWNNIKKYEKVTGHMFIFDEQKATGRGAWAKTLIKIAQNNRWVLLSATPGECWDDYATIFIANGFVKNRTVWKRDFCIMKPYVKYDCITGYRNIPILEKMRARLLVNMDYKSPNQRWHFHIPIKADKELEAYVMGERKFLDGRPIQSLAQAIPYIRMNAPMVVDKKDHLAEILREYSRVIVFYNFRQERDEIASVCAELGETFAEYNGAHHDEIPDEDRWCYAVNYASGAEAWNCITCHCMVFYSLNWSYSMMDQCCGRIDRRNNKYHQLDYYHFEPDLKIERALRACLRRKKNFEEHNENILNDAEKGDVQDDAW